MVLVSYSGKEINAKLVYYGPGLSGKTTNLEYIYGSIPGNHRGKMVSMKTKTERTLFFDFLPVQLGELSGFKTRFLLYTVPGQVYYNATRKLVLKGVDAVVFVADSKRGKMDENVESLENLRENLREHGLDLETIPWVLQYNKRDLPEVYTLQELDQVLNPGRVPTFEAVATNGNGVIDTFKGVSRLLLKKLSSEVGVPIVGAADGVAPSGAVGPAGGSATAGLAPAAGSPAAAGTSRAPSGQLDRLETAQPPTMGSAPPRPAPPSPSAAPTTPQARRAASGPIVRSDGSSAEEPDYGTPQLFESHAAANSGPVSGFEAPQVALERGATSEPGPLAGLGPAPTRVSDEEDLPPISRVLRSEPAAGGMRQRLARWLKRGDDEAREGVESTTSETPSGRGFFGAAEGPGGSGAFAGAAESASSRSTEGSFSSTGAMKASAEPRPLPAEGSDGRSESGPETAPWLTTAVPGATTAPPFGVSAEMGAALPTSGSAAPTTPASEPMSAAPTPPVQAPMAATPIPPARDTAAGPSVAAGSGAPAPASAAAGPIAAVASTAAASVTRMSPSIGGTGGSGVAPGAGEPREIVIPVRLRPEDIEAGVVVKLRIEAIAESGERLRRAA